VVLDTLTANDRAQLLEVYARSVMLLHLGRCADWVQLFEPRCRVRCADGGSFTGYEELLDLSRRSMRGEMDVAVGKPLTPARSRHYLNNITLFDQGARCAAGFAFLTIATIGGVEASRCLASGLYSDQFIKCPSGCWRFMSRTFTADAEAGVPFGRGQLPTASAA